MCQILTYDKRKLLIASNRREQSPVFPLSSPKLNFETHKGAHLPSPSPPLAKVTEGGKRRGLGDVAARKHRWHDLFITDNDAMHAMFVMECDLRRSVCSYL